MNRLYELLALSALTVSVWSFCGTLGAAEPRMRSGAVYQDLGVVTAALYEQGLWLRNDVIVELDARQVAAGFYRPDCDGLLLVAPLPTTAQGWGHIAPGLDLSGYSVQYVYEGVFHAGVPRARRLQNRLTAELRDQPAISFPRLVAVAEAGGCDLLATVESVLIDFSRGEGKLSDGQVFMGEQ